MATENDMDDGSIDDFLDGPSFTIGPPSEPLPQAAMAVQDRYRDKGTPYDEQDYQSEQLNE